MAQFSYTDDSRGNAFIRRRGKRLIVPAVAHLPQACILTGSSDDLVRKDQTFDSGKPGGLMMLLGVFLPFGLGILLGMLLKDRSAYETHVSYWIRRDRDGFSLLRFIVGLTVGVIGATLATMFVIPENPVIGILMIVIAVVSGGIILLTGRPTLRAAKFHGATFELDGFGPDFLSLFPDDAATPKSARQSKTAEAIANVAGKSLTQVRPAAIKRSDPSGGRSLRRSDRDFRPLNRKP